MKRVLLSILALTFACAAHAQTSGFPAKPRFQAVGVGTTAPAAVGKINLRATAGLASLAEFSGNGGTPLTDSFSVGQDSVGNGQLYNRGAFPLNLGANGTTNTLVLNGAVASVNGSFNVTTAAQATIGTFAGPNTGAGWNFVFRDTTNGINRGFLGVGTNTITGAAITDFGIAPGPSGRVLIGTANGVAIGTIFDNAGNVATNGTLTVNGASATFPASTTIGAQSVCVANGTNCNTLSATNLTSGTVPDARLSGTYTGALTFSALTAVTATTGTFTNATVGGSAVCRADGTNCPSATGAGANFVSVSTANATRTNTVTQSCDAALTVSLPNATARYKFSALLRFQGGGITANGWRVGVVGGGGTVAYHWMGTASVASTTTNVAPTNQINTNTDPFTATFNLAGIDTFVTLDGQISVTSPTAPTLCINWAQNAANATATTLVVGSTLMLTRLN